jgi:hypothetical protein
MAVVNKRKLKAIKAMPDAISDVIKVGQTPWKDWRSPLDLGAVSRKRRAS